MVTLLIASILLNFKKRIPHIQVMSASYLYLLLDIDSEDRFRTKLYNKGDDFNFPMANIRDRKALQMMTVPPGIPGSLASLLSAKTVYWENGNRKHKLWNIVSTIYICMCSTFTESLNNSTFGDSVDCIYPIEF
jgi:hypothetical protein